MKCQECDNAAVLHTTDIVNGKPVSHHVCSEHASDVLRADRLTPQQVPAPIVRQVMTDPQLRTALLDPAARQKLAAGLLPSLIVALNDAQPEVRIQAAFRIMAFGADAESAIEPLRETLNDEDARVRKIAGAAIVQIQSGNGWSLV
jgi:hypothetical protein